MDTVEVEARNYFDELPDEMLMEILEYFSEFPTRYLKTLSMVCRKWWNLIDSMFGLTDRSMFIVNRVKNEEDINSSHFPSRNYKSLYLKCDSNYNCQNAKQILAKLQIENLILECSFSKREDILDILKLTCKSLLCLTIMKGSIICGVYEDIIDFPKIRSFIGETYGFDKFHCLDHTTTITMLIIRCSSDVKLLERLLKSNGCSLEVLKLTISLHSYCYFKLNFPMDLPKLRSLEILNDGNDQIVLPDFIWEFKSIEYLKIDGYIIPKIKLHSIREMLPNLQKLEIIRSGNDCFSDLDLLIPCLTTLTYKYYFFDPIFTNICINPYLTSLVICLRYFTKAFVEGFVTKFPSLTDLTTLMCPAGINSDSISEAILMAQRWPHLSRLEINLEEKEKGIFPDDEYLEESYYNWNFICKNQSTSFPNLKTLILRSCRNLNVFFESVNIPQLLHLILIRCEELSESSYPSNFERLKTFSLIDCNVEQLKPVFKDLHKFTFELKFDELSELLPRIKNTSFTGKFLIQERSSLKQSLLYIANYFKLRIIRVKTFPYFTYRLINNLILIDVEYP